MNYTFELKELQATHIVYLHHQGDISLIPSSIRKLMQWAGPFISPFGPDHCISFLIELGIKIISP